MKTIYKVNATTVKNEEGTSIKMYGIDAVSEKGIVESSIEDVFDNKEEAESFSALCTELDLAPEHLRDVIEDRL